MVGYTIHKEPKFLIYNLTDYLVSSNVKLLTPNFNGNIGDHAFDEYGITKEIADKFAKLYGAHLPNSVEFIKSLNPDTESGLNLYQKVKGNEFWLDSSDIPKNQYCKIDYDTGMLHPVSENDWLNLPLLSRAFIIGGQNSTSIFIPEYGNSTLNFNSDYNSFTGYIHKILVIEDNYLSSKINRTINNINHILRRQQK